MPHHDDSVRLRHMLDAAEKAVSFVKGRSRSALDTDEQLVLALVRLLEILGEAASRVSEDMRQKTSMFPWQEIVATRNRLIHGYFDVDLDIVWSIVSRDLPPVIEHLKRILVEIGSGGNLSP